MYKPNPSLSLNPSSCPRPPQSKPCPETCSKPVSVPRRSPVSVLRSAAIAAPEPEETPVTEPEATTLTEQRLSQSLSPRWCLRLSLCCCPSQTESRPTPMRSSVRGFVYQSPVILPGILFGLLCDLLHAFSSGPHSRTIVCRDLPK